MKPIQFIAHSPDHSNAKEIQFNMYSPEANKMVDQIQFNLYSPEHQTSEEKEPIATNEIKMAFNDDSEEVDEAELMAGFGEDALQITKQKSLNRLMEAWKYIDDEVAASEPQYQLNVTKCIDE